MHTYRLTWQTNLTPSRSVLISISQFDDDAAEHAAVPATQMEADEQHVPSVSHFVDIQEGNIPVEIIAGRRPYTSNSSNEIPRDLWQLEPSPGLYISSNHVIIRIYHDGKIQIKDISSNGTYRIENSTTWTRLTKGQWTELTAVDPDVPVQFVLADPHRTEALPPPPSVPNPTITTASFSSSSSSLSNPLDQSLDELHTGSRRAKQRRQKRERSRIAKEQMSSIPAKDLEMANMMQRQAEQLKNGDITVAQITLEQRKAFKLEILRKKQRKRQQTVKDRKKQKQEAKHRRDQRSQNQSDWNRNSQQRHTDEVPSLPLTSNICRSYITRGNCKYKSRCRLQHINYPGRIRKIIKAHYASAQRHAKKQSDNNNRRNGRNEHRDNGNYRQVDRNNSRNRNKNQHGNSDNNHGNNRHHGHSRKRNNESSSSSSSSSNSDGRAHHRQNNNKKRKRRN